MNVSSAAELLFYLEFAASALKKTAETRSLSIINAADGPPSAGSHGSIPLKASGVHFGHFYYGGLHIAKVRQEHFALKRRVRFRRHVIAVVDTLD